MWIARNTGWMLVLALVGALPVGCGGPQVSDADINVMREPDMAEAMESEGTVVVDVRQPEAYAKGHLPGAINIYLPDIRSRDPRLAEAERIIVYGQGWRDPLSTAAAKMLMSMGYENVYEFKGGVEVWTNAERELVSSGGKPGRPDSAAAGASDGAEGGSMGASDRGG